MKLMHVWGLIALILVLPSCSSTPEEQSGTAVEYTADGLRVWNDSAMAANQIQLSPASERTFGSGLNANGRVEIPPQSRASITAPLGGFIRYIGPYEGQFVTKGTVLVRLDDPIYLEQQRHFLTEQAAWEEVDLAYQRAEKMHQQSAISEKEWQQARAKHQEQKAALSAARETIRQLGFKPDYVLKNGIQSYLEMTAPLTGYVRSVNGNLGQYVGGQQEILVLEDPDHVHIELAVFQKDIASLKKGQNFTYRLGENPTPYTGTVKEIGQAQTAEGFYIVHGHPSSLPEGGLRTGQFIRAQIQTKPAVRWALPEEALVYRENEPFVLRKGTKGLEWQPVVITHREDGWLGFESLPPGAYVVKHAHLLLEPEEAE